MENHRYNTTKFRTKTYGSNCLITSISMICSIIKIQRYGLPFDTIMGPRIDAFLCSKMRELRFSILYENCAFLPIFWGENGTVILVSCNSPFCENCFSLRFRDFSKSRSNENYFSQTFSRLKENNFSQTFSRLKASSRKIKA